MSHRNEALRLAALAQGTRLAEHCQLVEDHERGAKRRVEWLVGSEAEARETD